jgi:CheY-like chemotaxis protein
LLDDAASVRARSSELCVGSRGLQLRSIELRFRYGRLRRRLTGVIVALSLGPPAGDGASGTARTILVVDDDDGVRGSVADLLATTGHVVLQARSGHEASAVMRQQMVDVLVLDLKMADGDGFSVLEELDGASPIVVVHTATDEPFRDSVAGPSSAKVFQVLQKPVRPLDLIAVVREAIGRIPV